MHAVDEIGVSFVVPVHNGERTLDEALRAIVAQDDVDGRPFEIIVVDDGSRDESLAIATKHLACGKLRILQGPGRGAAAAVNRGVAAANHPVICQVDQDVVVHDGWLRRLLRVLLSASDVAAAQGHYVTAADCRNPWARVMGLDLTQRYAQIRGDTVDHVCTGNTVYRAVALRAVGGFEESFAYGYDNDMSYRLSAAGFRLAFCREAKATHVWRTSVSSYLKQQLGLGLGRLDLVARHPRRITGDQVSGLSMMLHAPLMAASLLLAVLALLLAAAGAPSAAAAHAAAGIAGCLALERLIAALRCAGACRDAAALLFPPVHLLRDAVWAAAIVVWVAKRAVFLLVRLRDAGHGRSRAPAGAGALRRDA